MTTQNNPEIWFITGSQHLYGPVALQQVSANAQIVVKALNDAPAISSTVVFKPVVKTAAEAKALCLAANADPQLPGLDYLVSYFLPFKDVD